MFSLLSGVNTIVDTIYELTPPFVSVNQVTSTFAASVAASMLPLGFQIFPV
jgi:hypothetical protein